jgi:hypothetical protein
MYVIPRQYVQYVGRRARGGLSVKVSCLLNAA